MVHHFLITARCHPEGPERSAGTKDLWLLLWLRRPEFNYVRFAALARKCVATTYILPALSS